MEEETTTVADVPEEGLQRTKKKNVKFLLKIFQIFCLTVTDDEESGSDDEQSGDVPIVRNAFSLLNTD